MPKKTDFELVCKAFSLLYEVLSDQPAAVQDYFNEEDWSVICKAGELVEGEDWECGED